MAGRCRCARCHKALLNYSRVRRAVAAIERGHDPAMRVAPTRARQHVEQLRAAGMSLSAIARAAGVSRTTVERLVHRQLKHVSRISAAALLAVQP